MTRNIQEKLVFALQPFYLSAMSESTMNIPWYQEWLMPRPRHGKHPLGMRRELWPLLLGFGYIAIIAALGDRGGYGGIRSDHVFIGCLCLLDFYNEKSRAFVRYFFPFILTGVIFDSMRYYYWWGVTGHIHVSEPYYRDLHYFGINVIENGVTKRVTPNEYFALYHNSALDVMTGLAYLTFVFEYLSAGFYMFIKKQIPLLWTFGWCFLIVNVVGYLGYFIYPAAPPWYITKYGLGPANLHATPDAGAGARFDQLFGTHAFANMYGKGIDVFGAYPSLHVAYPLLVVWITFYMKDLKYMRVPAILFWLLMCFSAIYLQHHYVVDILLGSTIATTTAICATIFLKRRERQHRQAGLSTT